MKIQPNFIVYSFFVLCLLACKEQVVKQEGTASNATQKIITAGSAMTEIVHRLGLGNQIIATDKTSTYPSSMQLLPSIGYRNAITAEGILSLGSDLLIAEKGYLTDQVLQQLQEAKANVAVIENPKTIAGTKAMIQEIATLLEVTTKSQPLIEQIDQALKQAKKEQATIESTPSVLFVYARGQGSLMVGGSNTFAKALIEHAGGKLATPEIDGFKPLTTEALVGANPDYLLFFDSGLKSLNGIEGVLKIPGVMQTTAGKNQQIIALDGSALSSFDTRIGVTIQTLTQLIHPKIN